jgi:RNA polymerase sigma-70 factor, ECF subfamily
VDLTDEKKLIQACLKGENMAFEAFYRRFAAKMLVVCSRYAHDADEAKDLLQDGFVRVFAQLHTFRSDGSLEGWVRRVMVTTSLENYRRTARNRETVSLNNSDLGDYLQPKSSDDILAQVSFDELLRMIQELSPGYRMVFNLYVFEGMKHHEIAVKLGISEGTSKSNLADARKILQRRVSQTMFDIR